MPAIVPLVLYNGEYKWTVERKFKNIINKSKLFGNNIIDFEYILIDINKYEKEELMELKDKLGEKIEDILIAKKGELNTIHKL